MEPEFWGRVDLLVSLATGALAIFALLVANARGAFFRHKRRRWLALTGLKTDCPVDIVLTTSDENQSKHGVQAMRPMTGLGQVRGLAQVARCLGGYLGNRGFSVFLSGSVASELNQHLVVLGGPAKNTLTRQLLHAEVPTAIEDSGWLKVDDVGCVFQVGQDRYELADGDLVDGVPTRDVAMVVIAPNPYSSSAATSSAIACLGMTSYGTEAAAQLLFKTLPDWPRRNWRALNLSRTSSDSRIVVIVAEVTITNRAVGAFRAVKAYTHAVRR